MNCNFLDLLSKLQLISSPDQARRLLVPRGRDCIGSSMLKKAAKVRNGAMSDQEIILNLKTEIKFLKEINDKLYMVYPKCFCHHLRRFKGKVPKSYCYCSEAWVGRLFEVALGRKVRAEIEKSILWGDKVCQIRIII